jgi:predicted small lipoprotein YifL
MRLTILVTILMVFALAACGDKPTAPESPDPSTYGKTIEPDHNVPEEDRASHKSDVRGGTIEMDHNIPEEHRKSYEEDVYSESE